MKIYILWSVIILFIVGCSSNKVISPPTEIKHEIKTFKTETEIRSIVSLSYKKDFTKKEQKQFTKKEQKQCALINAELALSEGIGKTVDEGLKESRNSNNSKYDINIPCISKENLHLINNLTLLNEENNSSYRARTWKISGSGILYIWASKYIE